MAKGTPRSYEDAVVADEAGWARWKPGVQHPGVQGECPTCGACHDPNGEDGLLMAMTCPECEEPGCDECMPMGRGCACLHCEDAAASETWQ